MNKFFSILVGTNLFRKHDVLSGGFKNEYLVMRVMKYGEHDRLIVIQIPNVSIKWLGYVSYLIFRIKVFIIDNKIDYIFTGYKA